MRYWIGVASQDHVARGVSGGFCQLCHGKAQALKRMEKGDWIIYYSPKEIFGREGLCQQFTAIGRVIGDAVYQFEMTKDFIPYRRDIEFLPARPVDIRPLIHQLNFIQNKSRWGYVFRFGHIEISRGDFELIAELMLQTYALLPENPPVFSSAQIALI
ncbi:MAG: EVE domain-containing protein [Gammaproteobacteria bacterium]|nr:MAG: EVE domain-containing protein [Gammaproteobacteria bacterium]